MEVQEIERDLPSSARDTTRKAQIQGLEKSLSIKVSQLLDLVNDEAKKYVPKPMNTDTSRSQRRENLTDRAVLEGVSNLLAETIDPQIHGETLTNLLTGIYGKTLALNEGERELFNIYTDRLAKLNDL